MTANPRRRCNESGCVEMALFGSPSDDSARRCELHRAPADVDYVQRECLSCRLPWVLGVDGLCPDCSPEGRRLVRAKERAVEAWLGSDDFRAMVPPGVQYVHDRAVEGGCSRRRPDFLWDLGPFAVCLEVDEWQHGRYQCAACDDGAIQVAGHEIRLQANFFRETHACTCEWNRLLAIKQDLGEVQMRVVRYNPDGFTRGGSTERSRVGDGRRRQALLAAMRATFARALSADDAPITVQYVCYDGVGVDLVSGLMRVAQGVR